MCVCVSEGLGVLLPNSTDAACGERPGGNSGALLHEPPHGEPEAVPQRVLINEQTTASLEAGVWIVPLVRGEPGR